jgi:hypothetical protein
VALGVMLNFLLAMSLRPAAESAGIVRG